jgi:hypothetical protein
VQHKILQIMHQSRLSIQHQGGGDEFTLPFLCLSRSGGEASICSICRSNVDLQEEQDLRRELRAEGVRGRRESEDGEGREQRSRQTCGLSQGRAGWEQEQQRRPARGPGGGGSRRRGPGGGRRRAPLAEAAGGRCRGRFCYGTHPFTTSVCSRSPDVARTGPICPLLSRAGARRSPLARAPRSPCRRSEELRGRLHPHPEEATFFFDKTEEATLYRAVCKLMQEGNVRGPTAEFANGPPCSCVGWPGNPIYLPEVFFNPSIFQCLRFVSSKVDHHVKP